MRETDCYQLEELEPRILLSADWNGAFEAQPLEESLWEAAGAALVVTFDPTTRSAPPLPPTAGCSSRRGLILYR